MDCRVALFCLMAFACFNAAVSKPVNDNDLTVAPTEISKETAPGQPANTETTLEIIETTDNNGTVPVNSNAVDRLNLDKTCNKFKANLRSDVVMSLLKELKRWMYGHYHSKMSFGKNNTPTSLQYTNSPWIGSDGIGRFKATCGEKVYELRLNTGDSAAI